MVETIGQMNDIIAMLAGMIDPVMMTGILSVFLVLLVKSLLEEKIGEIAGLPDKFAALSSEVEGLKDGMSDIGGSVRSLSSQMGEVNAALKDIEGEIGYIKGRINGDYGRR